MYKNRVLQYNLDSRPRNFKAILITGPRRSGKSTLSKVLQEEWGGGSYVVFDTPSDQALFAQDPEGFLRSLRLPAVLDEVQNVPLVFNYLKKIIDESKSTDCDYILTGSQQFQMMHKVSESLAGRILIKELYPFCSAENREQDFSRIKENLNSLIGGDTRFILPENVLNKDEIIKIISVGGFPSVSLLESQNERDDWLNSYLETYVQRDIRALSNIQDLSSFSRFISLIAGKTGKNINYSELGKDISINYKTAQHYLSLLSTSYLWRNISPYYVSGSEKRIIKSPKGLFMDTGLAMFLSGIHAEGLSKNPLFGSLFETFVISEIIKLLAGFGYRAFCYYFRVNQNNEVDLILEYGNKLIPIEIKASATPSSDWVKGIRTFKKEMKISFDVPSYVISMYPEVITLGVGVKNIPLQCLI